jgi:hypothetical protein
LQIDRGGFDTLLTQRHLGVDPALQTLGQRIRDVRGRREVDQDLGEARGASKRPYCQSFSRHLHKKKPPNRFSASLASASRSASGPRTT